MYDFWAPPTITTSVFRVVWVSRATQCVIQIQHAHRVGKLRIPFPGKHIRRQVKPRPGLSTPPLDTESLQTSGSVETCTIRHIRETGLLKLSVLCDHSQLGIVNRRDFVVCTLRDHVHCFIRKRVPNGAEAVMWV